LNSYGFNRASTIFEIIFSQFAPARHQLRFRRWQAGRLRLQATLPASRGLSRGGRRWAGKKGRKSNPPAAEVIMILVAVCDTSSSSGKGKSKDYYL